MGKEARVRAQLRQQRRDRLRQKFPSVAREMIENRAFARLFLQIAPLSRILIQVGISSDGLGLENHDAMVAIVKDALGIVCLSDEDFEYAIRLATPPECRETVQ